jgi:CheY-like chemotaxis protein
VQSFSGDAGKSFNSGGTYDKLVLSSFGRFCVITVGQPKQMHRTEHSYPRILSVSYDDLLLRTRQMILENEGYTVVSAHGLENSLAQCKKGGFDLFILGHSIPDQDKRQMVEAFRRECPAPIISLTRGASEQRVDGADYHADPEPEVLLKVIVKITPKPAAA